MPIITSLLDNDLYKLTMQQAMFHRYLGSMAESHFICRGENVDLRPYLETIKEEIQTLGKLKFSKDELLWLHQCGVFQEDYIDFLGSFSLNPELVHLESDAFYPGGIRVEVKGSWIDITLFEIFILAIISEVYSSAQENMHGSFLGVGRERLHDKVNRLKSSVEEEAIFSAFRLMEFGTRRRVSSAWQAEVVGVLKNELGDILSGTSNMHLARTLDIPVSGTMGHEWLQAHQALVASVEHSQKAALNVWLAEYGSRLGIALTDTISIDAFLKDFDKELATRYQGARHDSGDPILWGEAVLGHYRYLGIDAREKTLVFSDGLDFEKAIVIFKHFQHRTNVVFGIGTWLTNDIHLAPLQIVQKLVRCQGMPVAKLSDAPGKTFCIDTTFLRHLKQAYGV